MQGIGRGNVPGVQNQSVAGLLKTSELRAGHTLTPS